MGTYLYIVLWIHLLDHSGTILVDLFGYFIGQGGVYITTKLVHHNDLPLSELEEVVASHLIHGLYLDVRQ